MEEKDILRGELKKLQLPSMDAAKQLLMIMHLKLAECGKIPTMYDLFTLVGKEAPEWYKDWGWPCLTWELMSNKYGAAAKHGKDGKVSHFAIYLPPPQFVYKQTELPTCRLFKEKRNNNEGSNECYEKS